MITQSDEHPPADKTLDIYRPPQLTEERPLPIEAIRMDGNTQTRAVVNQKAIFSYLEEMKRIGMATFPPVDVFEGPDGSFWLGDGWHRIEAAKCNTQSEIMARIYRGTRLDALMHSANSNHSHGLMRTKADKHRSVEMILAEPKYRAESNRQIARWCGVGDQLVAKIRSRLQKSQVRDSRTSSSSAKRRGKDGKHYPAARKPRVNKQEAPTPTPAAPTEAEVVVIDNPSGAHEHGKSAIPGPERITSEESPAGTDEATPTTNASQADAPIPMPPSGTTGELPVIPNTRHRANAAADATSISSTAANVVEEEVGEGWADELFSREDVEEYLKQVPKIPSSRNYTEADWGAFRGCFMELSRVTNRLAVEVCTAASVHRRVAADAAITVGKFITGRPPIK